MMSGSKFVRSSAPNCLFMNESSESNNDKNRNYAVEREIAVPENRPHGPPRSRFSEKG